MRFSFSTLDCYIYNVGYNAAIIMQWGDNAKFLMLQLKVTLF